MENDVKEYIERYCRTQGIPFDDAVQHKIVKLYEKYVNECKKEAEIEQDSE